MKTAALALLLGSTIAACGPLPGYYPEDDVPGGAATPPPALPRASAPRGVTPPAPPTPAPTATTPAPAAGTPAPPSAPRRARGIVVVKTGSPDMRYLIDTQRRLCFFQTRGALTSVPCSSIPEAAAALGTDGASSTGSPASPAPARLAPETTPDAARPSGAPSPLATTDPRATPTAAEREHFERAYVQIFCDRRAGDDTEPARRIQAEGLSVERYTAIESWAARDERVWRELTRKAVLACTNR